MSERIGVHLAHLREFAQLTQYELADRLGRNRGWVSQIEQGIMDIKVQEVMRWAQACTAVQPPVRLEVVVHQVLTCKCGQAMYDTPPGSGLFPVCHCEAWR